MSDIRVKLYVTGTRAKRLAVRTTCSILPQEDFGRGALWAVGFGMSHWSCIGCAGLHPSNDGSCRACSGWEGVSPIAFKQRQSYFLVCSMHRRTGKMRGGRSKACENWKKMKTCRTPRTTNYWTKLIRLVPLAMLYIYWFDAVRPLCAGGVVLSVGK